MNFSQTDIRILRELRNNARISNKVLAARVNIPPSTCLARVHRLVNGGVISGFYAEFNPKEIGVGVQAMILIRMAMHDREAIDRFRSHIQSHDEVVSFYLVSGQDDFMMHVAVRDVEHLREFILQALTERPEVDHLETRLMFEESRNPGFPVYKGAALDKDEPAEG
ncbi:MAG TPA: Lrp/AsnC family transcriptional regulator [Gammaproteobacteria bacterium]|nr:Lrp/AsnC family transcriptional regulator [Gammaproteobacteria bacterium]